MATPGNIVTSTGVVFAAPAELRKVVLLAPPAISAEASLILHDHASAASGDVICEITVCERNGRNVVVEWEGGYNCALGVYATIAGTGAIAKINGFLYA